MERGEGGKCPEELPLIRRQDKLGGLDVGKRTDPVLIRRNPVHGILICNVWEAGDFSING